MEKKKTDNAQKKSPVVHFPSTYSVITASRILEHFSVALPLHRLKGQILHFEAFFHKLMFLPAKRLQFGITNSQCRDIQAYAQQKMISYLYSGEATKKEEEPGHQMRESIESKRQTLIETGKSLETWEEAQKNLTETIYSGLDEKVKAWRETVNQVTTEAISLLEGASFSLPDGFFDRLYTELDTLSASVKLHPETLTHLKLKAPLGIVVKAVVFLLSSNDKLAVDRSKFKSVKVSLTDLDKKLILILDDLGGFNKEGEAQIKQSQEAINELMTTFKAQARDISRILHDYYSKYGDSVLHTENAEQALIQGVDESVADNYTALVSH